MAKFMLDGREYCGSGSGVSTVKLTQAEYDALSDEKLSNNVIYIITDSDELSAKNVPYDGSVTGLGNNVQSAIDELNSNLILEGATIVDGATISANGVVSYPQPSKDGYEIASLHASCSGANNTNVVCIWSQDQSIIIFRNLTNQQITTGKLSYRALYIKQK